MDLKPRDRVTPVLQELHWLPVAERIAVQVVPDGPQVAAWTHAGLHLGLTDISCRCLLDLHCVLRRLATSSCCGHVDESATGISLSPYHEHGTRLPIELKLLRLATTFRRQLKTFLSQFVYGHRED